MKHILSTIIISSLIAVTASSCTGKFEEINSNPYQPGDLSEDDYALGSAMNNLAGCQYGPVYRLFVGRSFGRLFCRFTIHLESYYFQL